MTRAMRDEHAPPGGTQVAWGCLEARQRSLGAELQTVKRPPASLETHTFWSAVGEDDEAHDAGDQAIDEIERLVFKNRSHTIILSPAEGDAAAIMARLGCGLNLDGPQQQSARRNDLHR